MGDRPNDCLGFDPDGEVAWSTPHFTGFGGQGFPNRKAIELNWTASNPEGRLLLAEPLDVSGAERLEVRALLPLGADAAGFDVTLTDGAGHTDTVVLGAGDAWPSPCVSTAAPRWRRCSGCRPPASTRDWIPPTSARSAWSPTREAAAPGCSTSPPRPPVRYRASPRSGCGRSASRGSRSARETTPASTRSRCRTPCPARPAWTGIRIVTTRIGRQGYPVSGRAENVTVPAGSTGGRCRSRCRPTGSTTSTARSRSTPTRSRE